MKDVYDIVAESKKHAGEPLALATLVHAEGSSYRRPGARLLISADGNTTGSLSGGCIEDEIAVHARSVIATGKPMMLDFDTRRRFGCHGRIDVLIERIEETFFGDLAAELDARRSCSIVTTPNGSHVVAGDDHGSSPDEAGKAGSFPGGPFVQVVHPPIKLFIFGDGPDTAPLEKLCALLGWRAVVVAETHALPPALDEWTAAIVKSHNFGRDFVALGKLLPLKLRYVGLIGPKKRRDQLLNDLLEIGISIHEGFFAPAGLDLNAEGPEEIAVSIISEIQRVFGKASGKSLRDRKLPIHRKDPAPFSV